MAATPRPRPHPRADRRRVDEAAEEGARVWGAWSEAALGARPQRRRRRRRSLGDAPASPASPRRPPSALAYEPSRGPPRRRRADALLAPRHPRPPAQVFPWKAQRSAACAQKWRCPTSALRSPRSLLWDTGAAGFRRRFAAPAASRPPMLKMPVPAVPSCVRKRDASTSTAPMRQPSPALCSVFPALVAEALPGRRDALPDVMVATLRFRGGGSGGGRRRSGASTPPPPPASSCHCCNVCRSQSDMGCNCDNRSAGGGARSAGSDKGGDVGCSCYDSDEGAEPPGREHAAEEPPEAARGGRRTARREPRDESPDERKAGRSAGLEDSEEEPFVGRKRKTYAESKRKRDDFSDEDSFHESPRPSGAREERREELEGDASPPRPAKPHSKGRDSGSYQGSVTSAKSRTSQESHGAAPPPPPPPPPPRAPRARRQGDIPEEAPASDGSWPRSPGRRPDAWEERSSDGGAGAGRSGGRSGGALRRRGDRDGPSAGRGTRGDFRRSLDEEGRSSDETSEGRTTRSAYPGERRSSGDSSVSRRRSRDDSGEKSRGFAGEKRTRSDFPDNRSRADFLDERKNRAAYPDDRRSRIDVYNERKSRADLYGDRSRPDILDERKSRGTFPDERKSRADISDGQSSDFLDERRGRAELSDDERRGRAESPDVRRSRGDFPGERSRHGGLDEEGRAGARGRGSAGDMTPRESKPKFRDGCPPDCTGLPETKSTKPDSKKKSKRGGRREPCILKPKCHRDGVCPELAGISKCNEKQPDSVQPRSSTETSRRPTSGPGSSCSDACTHTRGTKQKKKKKKKNNECCRKIFPCCVPREGESSKQSIERSIKEIPFRVRRVQPRGLARLVQR